jgi:hypothetical protein
VGLWGTLRFAPGNKGTVDCDSPCNQSQSKMGVCDFGSSHKDASNC